MNILITGGLGYIGSILTKTLGKLGHNITVFDNLMFDQWSYVHHIVDKPNIKYFNEDILDWSDNLINAIQEADIIIPLAAYVGAPLCDIDPKRATHVNFSWYTHLLKVINPNTVIIYPNTNSGYGTTQEGVICTEESVMAPISLYSKTKSMTEQLLLESHEKSICLRLATVYGLSYRPRLDLMVNNLVYKAINEGEIDLFDGHFRRNFIHIQDLVNVFLWFVENHSDKCYKQVYNVGNDAVNTTKKDLAHKIRHVTGCSVVENKTKTDKDKRDYMVSSEKLYNLTGLSPSRDLEFGIREMAKFCSNLRLGSSNMDMMFNYTA